MRQIDITVGTRARVQDQYNYRYNVVGVVTEIRKSVIDYKFTVKTDGGEEFEIDRIQVQGLD